MSRRSRRITLVVALASLAAPAGASASGVVTEFPLPVAASAPFGITAGPDGGVWFAMPGGVAKPIGRIDPATGQITTYATAPGGTTPKFITVGSDGNLWFTDQTNNSVGRITPTGTTTVFTALGLATPRGIASGADGNLYVVSSANDRVVELTTAGTKVGDVLMPTTGLNTQEITAGPDGNLWYTAFSDPGFVGRVNLDATPRTITEFHPAGQSLLGIATGPDGNLWFSEASGTPKLGRVSPTFTGFGETAPLTAGTSDPEGMAAGRDGALWFAIFNGSQVGRATPDLQVTQFSAGITANSGPREIVAGPDGNMWFTEETGNAIGRITVDAPPVPAPPAPPVEPIVPPPFVDTTPPVVSRLTLSATTFVVGAKPTAVAAAKARRKKHPTGTTIAFTLSEPASVRLAFSRVLPGRKQHGACRKPSRANRRGKACTYGYGPARALQRAGRAGKNTVAFTGRVGTKRLAAAPYRLSVTATDAAGNHSVKPATARFTVASQR